MAMYKKENPQLSTGVYSKGGEMQQIQTKSFCRYRLNILKDYFCERKEMKDKLEGPLKICLVKTKNVFGEKSSPEDIIARSYLINPCCL